MGMFDYIRCDHPLPAPEAEGMEFQTKDACCDLDQLLIRVDGTLWRMESLYSDNQLGRLSDYFGEVFFYTSVGGTPVKNGGWLEFRARFVDGKLHGPILLVKDTRSIPLPEQGGPQ